MIMQDIRVIQLMLYNTYTVKCTYMNIYIDLHLAHSIHASLTSHIALDIINHNGHKGSATN